ncbi:MAG: hypothetical protein UW86_C0001G0028 [Microgenomates group bacterium GW2011_GWA1_Microgenomates_45_10]|nr:MAG: hypothetical protein UW86_C0001G0028 [Microgenomates group bacterium GW2011_GWA1_Microgenomates_45_10]
MPLATGSTRYASKRSGRISLQDGLPGVGDGVTVGVGVAVTVGVGVGVSVGVGLLANARDSSGAGAGEGIGSSVHANPDGLREDRAREIVSTSERKPTTAFSST